MARSTGKLGEAIEQRPELAAGDGEVYQRW